MALFKLYVWCWIVHVWWAFIITHLLLKRYVMHHNNLVIETSTIHWFSYIFDLCFVSHLLFNTFQLIFCGFCPYISSMTTNFNVGEIQHMMCELTESCHVLVASMSVLQMWMTQSPVKTTSVKKGSMLTNIFQNYNWNKNTRNALACTDTNTINTR